MNDNQTIDGNQNNYLKLFDDDILDDLATPYFRKSVSYAKNRSDELVEERINDFLDSIGVHFVEPGEESVYFSAKKLSITAATEARMKSTSLNDMTLGSTRLSSFNMNTNDLFQRRKISSMKMNSSE